MSGHLAGGRYRLRERLGHGGMSVVWRATDEVLGRDVAVKVLAPQLADDPTVLRRLRDEARAAAALRHLHIVEVYDYGEDLLPYVVMELVDGRTLAELIRGGALPWRTAVAIGAQVAAALAAAHARGLVHCDVKPANVMVTDAGVKLVDFGIAAAVGAVEDPEAEVLGTPAYLSPERIAGGPVVAATDVYAVGLLLHLALAGQPRWQTSTVTQMLRAHVYADPEPLPSVAGLPSSVTRLVRRCLAKRPDDRPSAAEVAERLGKVAGLPPAKLLDVSEFDRPTRARWSTDRPNRVGRSASSLTTQPVVAAALANAPIEAARRRIAALTSAARSQFAALTAPAHSRFAALNTPARRRSVALTSPARRRLTVGALAGVAVLTGGLALRSGDADAPISPAAAAAAPVTPSPAATKPQACTVHYALRGTATGRAAAKVTIHNTGKVPVPAWKLSFALPSDQRLVKGWSATWQQNGRTVQAAGGRLPAGGKAATSFSTTYGKVAALPVTFRLNGTACQAQMSVQPLAVTKTATRPAPPAPKPKPKAEKPQHHGDDEDEGDED